MCYQNMDIYVWLLTFCISFAPIHSSCKRDSRCKISRIHGMKGADCYNKDMTAFSQCLPSDVEIIDLSRNRIRKLTQEDLSKYSDLKMLYLSDNLIMTIDEQTFEGKDYLHTLDLSLNAISKLPPVLFHLPSLQSLYLRHNLNVNIVDVVERSKPITSPLYHMDISYIMSEEPSELPDFGVLSTLKKYNISGNKLVSVSTKNFAGLCSLQMLDTSNVTIEYEDQCECWKVNQWLKERKVNFKPFFCGGNEIECPDQDPSLEDLETFDDCKQQIEENLKKSKIKTALLIALPIAGVILVSILYFVFKRRQRQKRQQKRDQSQETMLNNTVTFKT